MGWEDKVISRVRSRTRTTGLRKDSEVSQSVRLKDRIQVEDKDFA